MASTRELRRRIRSIASTAQITKAQQAAIDLRPFVRMFYRLQRTATTHAPEFTHPLLEAREVKKRLVILVAGDKGLCGALNSNLFRLAGRENPHTTVFIAAGRKASQFVARTRRQLVAEFPYGDSPRYEESRAIAALARDLFLKGEVDEVKLMATRFVNTLVQQPVTLEFLPVGNIKGVEIPGAPPPEKHDNVEYKFEPSARDLIEFLLGHYLNIVVHIVLINAKASEQSARMVSMKGATDNATEMIKHLSLELNKLRQGHITQELLEIAGGQAG